MSVSKIERTSDIYVLCTETDHTWEPHVRLRPGHIHQPEMLHAHVRVHLEELIEFAHLEKTHRVEVGRLEFPPLRLPRCSPATSVGSAESLRAPQAKPKHEIEIVDNLRESRRQPIVFKMRVVF